jgi:hypothetical protein
MNLLDDTFPMSYPVPQTEIICQSYAPGKLIHQTTQNGVHKTVGFSSSGVKVFYFLYDKKSFEASFQNILLVNASSRHISSQR